MRGEPFPVLFFWCTMSETPFNNLTFDLDLDLDSPLPQAEAPNRGMGRRAIPLPIPLEVRELTDEEVYSLAQNGPSASSFTLKKIRGSHHFMARAHVAGMKNSEISRLIGYSPTTISIALGQPVMQELIEEYREKLTEATFDFAGRLSALGMMSLDALEESLEEGVTPDLALKVAQFASDRIGFGPSSTVNNKSELNAHFTQEQMLTIRAGIVSRRQEKGGDLVLIDPAERRERTQIDVEERRLPRPETSEASKAPNLELSVHPEGTPSSPEVERNPLPGSSVRKGGWGTTEEDLLEPDGDL